MRVATRGIAATERQIPGALAQSFERFTRAFLYASASTLSRRSPCRSPRRAGRCRSCRWSSSSSPPQPVAERARKVTPTRRRSRAVSPPRSRSWCRSRAGAFRPTRAASSPRRAARSSRATTWWAPCSRARAAPRSPRKLRGTAGIEDVGNVAAVHSALPRAGEERREARRPTRCTRGRRRSAVAAPVGHGSDPRAAGPRDHGRQVVRARRPVRFGRRHHAPRSRGPRRRERQRQLRGRRRRPVAGDLGERRVRPRHVHLRASSAPRRTTSASSASRRA